MLDRLPAPWMRCAMTVAAAAAWLSFSASVRAQECVGCAPWQECANGVCLDGPALGGCPLGGVAVAQDCFGVDSLGCCAGKALYYCESAATKGCPDGMASCLCALDCGAEGGSCSWVFQYFGCAAGVPEPSPDGTLSCDWYVCTPDCDGIQCGPDGCGGSCGQCDKGMECTGGQCVPACVPKCDGIQCGPDGCGGSCGGCKPGYLCVGGMCQGQQGGGCEPAGTPGCGGCTCEKCVCGMDPYCCEVQWDSICVDECVNECGGCEPAVCGDGMCANGENCAACPADCGCPPGVDCINGFCGGGGGEGCTSHPYTGCGGCPCEACVCNMDPFCCNNSWDGICVSECWQNCGADCGMGGCGNWMCEGGENCETCPGDCPCVDGGWCEFGQCVGGEICGDWACTGWENCDVCPNDCPCKPGTWCQFGECVGGGEPGDGCTTTPFPFCGGCKCEACVCGMDSYCCSVSWDGLCVSECQSQCGGCGPSYTCGDGTCNEEGENCESCPADCSCKPGDVCFAKKCCKPSCAGKECGEDGCGGTCSACDVGVCANYKCHSGVGCAVTSTPGCGGCPCQACVCDSDSYCCKTAWDEGCVQLCILDCDGCGKLDSCGDGACNAAQKEDCGTCPEDCPCGELQACVQSQCAVDYCELGIGPQGCCMGDALVLCAQDEVSQTDCTLQGGVCGWYTGNSELPAGYYCGPEGSVSTDGDPSGTYPIACPECTGSCKDKECGNDGCGGDCGSCAAGQACVAHQCVACEDTCGSKECGPNPCGQSCGECGAGKVCKSGQCVECVPDCAGKQCGPDGCGGSCGECDATETCVAGVCKFVCKPDCTDKECGSDGCGGNCGVCPMGLYCLNFACSNCTPSCAGKQCGDDGCGGNCGECPEGSVCNGVKCAVVCVPACDGKECGPDGCDGDCGQCDDGVPCEDGTCVVTCTPDCGGKECGPDGCDGSCGECQKGWTCTEGKCEVPCTAQCEGKECGDDGCGGVCGQCDEGLSCDGSGKCAATAEPDVTGDATGDTGGGGSSSGSCTVAAGPGHGPLALLVLLATMAVAATILRPRAQIRRA